MKEILKKTGKILLHAVIWVFVLSIRVDGRTLFSYANEALIQNSVVRAADQELADLWYRVSETARVTFSDMDPRKPEKKSLQ